MASPAVGHAHAAHAQRVAQRAVDQRVAQRVAQPVPQADGFAVQNPGADAARQLHAGMEQLALDDAGVFHADHHMRQQPFQHARRREVIGGADVAHVDGDGVGRLGMVDREARDQQLRVREHVLADPGRRQVGQHVFAVGQLLHFGHGAGAVDQSVVREHHALGLPVVPDVRTWPPDHGLTAATARAKKSGCCAAYSWPSASSCS